jgi:CRISPR-associated protein Csb2
MWVADNAARIDTAWQPGEVAFERQMRVAEAGTLTYLRTAFNADAIEHYQQLAEAIEQSKGREQNTLRKEIGQHFPAGRPNATRPKLARWQGYTRRTQQRKEEEEVRCGPFDPKLIVLTRKDEQRILGLETTLQLTSALRDAAMKAAGENVPEWLSGHQPDGSPSCNPHVAFFPLPFAGAKYADGHLMGLAMAIPRQIDSQSQTRETALRSVIGPLLFRATGEEKVIRLWRNNVWEWNLEREQREYPPVTLRAKTWAAQAREWASVTPVVLHHYPKRNRENDMQRILLQAFESAGLPSPSEMRIQAVSLFEGAGHARSIPDFTEGGESMCRYQVHVVVKFPVLVEGPVLVGRGRFRGYGLLRPVGVKLG